jgi:hypothetical protein
MGSIGPAASEARRATALPTAGRVSPAPVAIGMTAHAAAARADGRGRVLARLSASTYLRMAGEIVWLAGAGAPLHPRAILTAHPAHPEEDDVRLESGSPAPWRPAAPVLAGVTSANLAERWRDLAAAPLGTPGGFGVLLAGQPLAFPLDGARDPAEALARACARDDAAGAGEAALALLGVGGGLTPSGDDYVGGAFFARALLEAARPGPAAAWRRAATRVVAAAPGRTHPISAALLGDLAAGRSWAPLHDLVTALAAGTPGAARAAARRLVALGHSSGWDMLAGVGAGLGALS